MRTHANMVLRAALLALTLAVVQNAHAEPTKMVMTRPFKAGTVANYKVSIKASIQGMDIIIDQSQKQTIKAVKDNGNVVILSEDLGGTMKLNGTEQEQKPGAPTTETRDKLGKLVDLSHEQEQNAPFTPEVQKLIASISDLMLSEKEIAEGDAWETQFDNPATKDNKVKVKTTYQGTEKVAGVDLWKFKQTSEAVVNADGSKLTNDGVIWINPVDGLLEKMEGTFKNVPTQFGPIDIAMSIQRAKTPVAGDAKADKLL